MPQATYSVSLSAGGISIQSSRTISGNRPQGLELPLPAAKDGDLTTRTSAMAGVITLPSGHGIQSGDYVDLYFDGGKQYDVHVTNATATTITVSGGNGEDLPTQGASIAVAPQVSIDDAMLNAAGLQVIGMMLAYSARTGGGVGRLVLAGEDQVDVLDMELLANVPRIYDFAAGDDNFIETALGLSSQGPCLLSRASHSDTVNAATLKLAAIENV